MEYAIEVKNLKKYFKIPSERGRSIKRAFFNFLMGKSSYTHLYAVDGVSLKVREGEFVGVTGRNGSGKSTLLKLVSGVMTPDSGEIMVNGSISPFLELGAGFCKELSTVQNIYLYGSILGIPKEEIAKKVPKILEFAELERFRNAKLGGFSSGMRSRLGFSTAIQLDADIFLVDEALAVGDINFQHKCFDAFERVKKAKKTVLFVSHDVYALERFCERLLLMENGKIIDDGKPKDIIKKYALTELRVQGKMAEERRRVKRNEELFEQF